MTLNSAVLLAAGKGERMWPLTSTRPKPLVEVLCRPLIEYQLEALKKAGIQKIALVVHSHEDAMKRKAAELSSKLSVELTVIKQSSPLGTGHALMEAIEKGGIEGEIIVLYSDIFMTPSKLQSSLEKITSSPLPSIAASRVEDLSKYGALEVSQSGHLSRIWEKSSELSGREGLANAGIMKLDAREIMEELRKTKPSERGEIELTSAVESLSKKEDVSVVELEGEWMDVGTPWDLLRANEAALRELCRGAKVELDECVMFDEERAVIEDPVVIRGPVFIKGNVELGPCTHVREYSVICGENKLGFSVQVKNSILMRGAKVPHLNYVGDSIIGEGVNLGAGTITANVRHDGKSVKSLLKGVLTDTGRRKFGTVIGDEARTGINTSILPGVKIGAGAWINAGCIVDRDVPDRAILKCEQTRSYALREDDRR